jgi:hypothetical protein
MHYSRRISSNKTIAKANMKILASCLQFPEEPVALPCQARRGISQGWRRAIDDLKSYRTLTAAI